MAEGNKANGAAASLEKRLAEALGEIERLKSLEEIRQLKYRYWRAMDTADMDLLRTVLAEDFRFDLRGSEFVTQGSDRETFVEMMRQNFNNQRATQHQGHHPEIAVDAGGNRATGIWYLQDIVHDLRTNVLLFGTNFYHDEYVRIDGRWLHQASRWERHLEVRQPLGFVPTYTDHYLGKHGPTSDGLDWQRIRPSAP